jgi:hypothetical protein
VARSGGVMANAFTNTGVMDPGRIELKSYRVTLPLESLSIGVDNIHHDVFLSPKFVQVARDYLFDLIRQKTAEPTFRDRVPEHETGGLDGIPQTTDADPAKLPDQG